QAGATRGIHCQALECTPQRAHGRGVGSAWIRLLALGGFVRAGRNATDGHRKNRSGRARGGAICRCEGALGCAWRRAGADDAGGVHQVPAHRDRRVGESDQGGGNQATVGPFGGDSAMRITSIGFLLAAVLAPALGSAADLPLFDAHIHYSHDAWDNLPPKEAVLILRKAGLKRALVSSSGDEGTQRLVAEAPDLVVPSLRPYRKRGDVGTWVRDDSVVAFLGERLLRQRYAAIGEFHVYGADADLPVPRRMVALAKQYGLVLHAHSDKDAIERLFTQYPEARILWAHSGFERPEEVRDMLRRHKNLWCDLAYRSDQGANGKVPVEWREVFTEFPDRFMVGTDTFTPERWHYIVEHANWSRAWLADLPPALAERIAYRNGDALFAG